MFILEEATTSPPPPPSSCCRLSVWTQRRPYGRTHVQLLPLVICHLWYTSPYIIIYVFVLNVSQKYSKNSVIEVVRSRLGVIWASAIFPTVPERIIAIGSAQDFLHKYGCWLSQLPTLVWIRFPGGRSSSAAHSETCSRPGRQPGHAPQCSI